MLSNLQLKKAVTEGRLAGAMLDRRSKLKRFASPLSLFSQLTLYPNLVTGFVNDCPPVLIIMPSLIELTSLCIHSICQSRTWLKKINSLLLSKELFLVMTLIIFRRIYMTSVHGLVQVISPKCKSFRDPLVDNIPSKNCSK